MAAGLVAPDDGENAWRVKGVASLPDMRGRGIGTIVVKALVLHAAGSGALRVWCKARVRARSLYERLDFAVVSDEFEIRGIGPHVLMERTFGPEDAQVEAGV